MRKDVFAFCVCFILIVCGIVGKLEGTDEKIGDLFVCLIIVVRLFVLGKLERTDEKRFVCFFVFFTLL